MTSKITRSLAALVLSATFLMPACAGSTVAPVTPGSAPSAAQIQQDENTAIAALSVVSLTAEAANSTTNPSTGQPFLSTADTTAIVTTDSQLTGIISAAKTGWQSALLTAWADFQSHLSAAQQTQFAVPIIAVTVAINTLVAATGGGSAASGR